MSENYLRRLVQGLIDIGDRLDLQIFTASNGVALLDWSASEHRVLTVWAHERGVELRIGVGVHALLPLDSEDHLNRILGLVQRVVDGSWFETYAVDAGSGAIETLSWRLGIGTAHSYGSPGGARTGSNDRRIHHRGQPWGPRRKRTDVPPG